MDIVASAGRGKDTGEGRNQTPLALKKKRPKKSRERQKQLIHRKNTFLEVENQIAVSTAKGPTS